MDNLLKSFESFTSVELKEEQLCLVNGGIGNSASIGVSVGDTCNGDKCCQETAGGDTTTDDVCTGDKCDADDGPDYCV